MCLALASPLKAEEAGPTAADLYDECTGTPRQQAECHTWIIGFFDGLLWAQAMARIKHLTPVTCFPNGLTGEQVRLIVEKHLRDHPEELHHSARLIVAIALDQAFPCR
jgi:hypothetical protein